jgi:hypothetical protein
MTVDHDGRIRTGTCSEPLRHGGLVSLKDKYLPVAFANDPMPIVTEIRHPFRRIAEP